MAIADLIAQIETNQRLNVGAGNQAGYFGGLMLRMLRELDGIDERLVTAVVGRYLEAYDAYQRAAEDILSVWRIAFDSGAVHSWRQSLLITQHLALGVHAHVGYDLPAAAMDLCESKDELSALKSDFAAYSKLVFECLDRARSDIGKFSPLADTLELFGASGHVDATSQRKLSWRIAGLLVKSNSGHHLLLQDYNRLLTELARRIREPGEDQLPVLDFVRRFESDENEFGVGEVIEAIQGGPA